MKDKMGYYRKKVLRFIFLFTKNEDLAQDLTHDVLYKVWNRQEQIKSLEDIDNYILKIAKHHVFDHFKKLARDKEYQKEVWYHMEKSTNKVESHLITQEITKKMEAIVMTLPPRQKEIYQLNQRKGMTLEEIASSLNIAPRTARNHLNRAKKVIRSQINPDSFLFWLLMAGCFGV